MSKPDFKWKDVSLLEKTNPPATTYFVKPTHTEDTKNGGLKTDPAIKIKFEMTGEKEITFDIDKYCEAEARTRALVGRCPLTPAGMKKEAQMIREMVIQKIETLPEFEMGQIRPYVPRDIKKLEADIKRFAEDYGVTEDEARAQLTALKEAKEAKESGEEVVNG